MKLRSFRKEDVKGKKVLLRVDFNVPLKDGKVTDTTRIEAHRKTLEALLEAGAKVALHLTLDAPRGSASLKCPCPLWPPKRKSFTVSPSSSAMNVSARK